MRRFWDIVIEPILDAVQPKILVEIGSDRGDNTSNLLEFCQHNDARLHVIDPLPKYDFETWKEKYHGHLIFHKDLSLNALPLIEKFDVVLIDGDHNWHTVFNELKLIEQKCQENSQVFPLVMLHDIGWPYGRRDLYYDPENIPDEHQQPYEKKGMRLDSPGLVDEGGLNHHLYNAVRANESKSGVLTAIEDFLGGTRQQLDLIKLPGLHGLGILVPEQSRRENAELANLLEKLNPSTLVVNYVERLEEARLEEQVERSEQRAKLQKLRKDFDELSKDFDELSEDFDDLRAEFQAESTKLRDAQKEAAGLRRKLNEAHSEIRRGRADARQARKETRQARADTNRLKRWLDELDAGVAALLDSRQWKVGYAVGEVYRRIRRRPRTKTPQKAVTDALAGYHNWQESQRQLRARSVTGGQPNGHEPTASENSPQADPNVGTTEGNDDSVESEADPFLTTASKQRYHGSPEYVLRELGSLPPPTILIPIYNAYENVKICLEAVVRNTTAPAELLLVNDASSDLRISSLLEEYEILENVRVLENESNLGFVKTVNRGFAESRGDVVLLNSDTEVTPRWLENLMLAAYRDSRTATATAISNNAGAFSVPDAGVANSTPKELDEDNTGRLIMQHAEQIYPRSPTSNGFCMYIKRAALNETGGFDADNFPRGYGEENDFCMRALKLGWNHVVDDATFVFHERLASFGAEKNRLLAHARKALNRIHPEYTRLARAFVVSEDMKRVGRNTEAAFRRFAAEEVQVKPRVLYVIHQGGGGTPHTNLDLMEALADRYSPYLLVSDSVQLSLFRYTEEGLVPLEQWDLRDRCQPTEFSRPDYRAIVFELLVRYRFELVHVRHLLGHTFDLPEIAAQLDIPVVLSFHDFYFSCPTIHLLDDDQEYCGGICTPGFGQCTLPLEPLKDLPILKHAWLHTWRDQVEKMTRHVDVFVTTSGTAKEVYLRSLPHLRNRRFEVIEHGRDLIQEHLAASPDGDRIKILIPGNIGLSKGGHFIQDLKQADVEDRLEFHLLGNVASSFKGLGVEHGPYERGEFNNYVRDIRPSFMGVFSIWPETYCHTLTEAWAAGVPVLASDIGTLRERVTTHGGGWLLNHKNPSKSYRRILEIASDKEAYEQELERANLHGIRSTREMADNYEALYKSIVHKRRAFSP